MRDFAFTRQALRLVEQLENHGTAIDVSPEGKLIATHRRGAPPASLLAEAKACREQLLDLAVARQLCRTIVQAEQSFWEKALADVSHELTPGDRARLTAIEADLKAKTWTGDVKAVRELMDTWMWARHPLRWLPHGDCTSHLPRQDRKRVEAIYEREVMTRCLMVLAGQRGHVWPRCQAGECKGACTPAKFRVEYLVTPGEEETWLT